MPHSGNKLVIEPLNQNHNRSNFDCGVYSLNDYIKKQAKQDMRRHLSQVFVAIDSTLPDIIVGYYTLSSLSIELDNLPKMLSKKLPGYAIPAALIGRLAVNQNLHGHGHGIGKMLLMDAIKRTLSVRENIAIYAVVVDAIDTKAELFYKQFGFTNLCAYNSRLFLTIKSIKE